MPQKSLYKDLSSSAITSEKNILEFDPVFKKVWDALQKEEARMADAKRKI